MGAVGADMGHFEIRFTRVFDLVLMDIQMPLMNGEDALREIRRNEQGTSYRQPVIALTAYALRGEKERFLEAGFDGYISKPLDIKELMYEMKWSMALNGITVKNTVKNIHEEKTSTVDQPPELVGIP